MSKPYTTLIRSIKRSNTNENTRFFASEGFPRDYSKFLLLSLPFIFISIFILLDKTLLPRRQAGGSPAWAASRLLSNICDDCTEDVWVSQALRLHERLQDVLIPGEQQEMQTLWQLMKWLNRTRKQPNFIFSR